MTKDEFIKEVIQIGKEKDITLVCSRSSPTIIVSHKEKEIDFHISYGDWKDRLNTFKSNFQQYHQSLMYSATRVELIDNGGRQYSNWNVKSVEFSIQDEGKTLKIFLK